LLSIVVVDVPALLAEAAAAFATTEANAAFIAPNMDISPETKHHHF
jgi:hypothetical protein